MRCCQWQPLAAGAAQGRRNMSRRSTGPAQHEQAHQDGVPLLQDGKVGVRPPAHPPTHPPTQARAAQATSIEHSFRSCESVPKGGSHENERSQAGKAGERGAGDAGGG